MGRARTRRNFLKSIFKIENTISDNEEGFMTGMWAVGLTPCGNDPGLNEEQVKALADKKLNRRLKNGDAPSR
jgi:hypothetical protein